eukprot:TRINITY_DN10802_c0_g1_i2.p1 TRINITY_DN10802_c0_g1~~TRINITY_DN10802_c0_g1_i2.p1  ORF type:complete len:606 (+),score=151.68 TRINITY_DN10802_c0_g1_i2:44-1861(+)
MDAAASAAAGASAAAAALSASSEARPRAGLVAAAAAAGGLGGYLLWQALGGGDADGASCRAVNRALSLLDAAQKQQPKQQEDALDGLAFCKEVEVWVGRLCGRLELASPALRLATRAHHLERHAVSRSSFPDGREGYMRYKAALKREQENRLAGILRRAGVDRPTALRAINLMAKEINAKEDREMQILEDALSLVFLERELPALPVGEAQRLADILAKALKKMSPAAQALALSFRYDTHTFGCFVEAMAVAEQLDRTAPMVSPRLPKACVSLLRQSWKQVPQDSFRKEFFDRLYIEDSSLQQIFQHPMVEVPENAWNVVQLMLDLLDVENVPRLERFVHALAGLAFRHGRFRLAHLAPIKRALVRTVTSHASKQEKKKLSQAWEAFFYALAAVAAPPLVLQDNFQEVVAATACSLPIPSGGTHAAMMAANGASLLEMSLKCSALSRGGSAVPEEVLGKLSDARGWLIECVRDDVNAYCGLVSSVYAQGHSEDQAAASTLGSSTAEETERRRWTQTTAEVPMRVTELAMGTAVACLTCKSAIKPSMKVDWIAGAKLLRTATEISLKNVVINIRDMAVAGKATDVEKRLAKIRDMEPPWEDLIDVHV